MPKVSLLVLIALALAGCNPSDRETRAGGYASYGEYLKAHSQGQVTPAPQAPVMTENGAYGADATAGAAEAPSGTIGADTLAVLKATAPTQ